MKRMLLFAKKLDFFLWKNKLRKIELDTMQIETLRKNILDYSKDCKGSPATSLELFQILKKIRNYTIVMISEIMKTSCTQMKHML